MKSHRGFHTATEGPQITGGEGAHVSTGHRLSMPAQLNYYTITLLHDYIITLLHYYIITLLQYYTITLLH